jgi:hypothetical protein
LEDPVSVAISKLMEAQGGEWTYDEFKKGCGQMQADSVPKWVSAVQKVRAKMNNDDFYS